MGNEQRTYNIKLRIGLVFGEHIELDANSDWNK